MREIIPMEKCDAAISHQELLGKLGDKFILRDEWGDFFFIDGELGDMLVADDVVALATDLTSISKLPKEIQDVILQRWENE